MEARTRAPYMYVARMCGGSSRVCSSQVVRFCGRDAAARRPAIRTSYVRLSGDGETYVQENGGLAVGVVLLSEGDGDGFSAFLATARKA